MVVGRTLRGHRNELPIWFGQAFLIAYEAISTPRMILSTRWLLLALLALPTALYLRQSWLGVTHPPSSPLRVAAWIFQHAVLFIAIRGMSPGLLGIDTPLVALGVPYACCAIIRRQRRAAFWYSVTGMMMAVLLPVHWGLDAAARSLLQFRALEAWVIIPLLAVYVASRLEAVDREQEEIAACLKEREAAAYQEWLRRLEARFDGGAVSPSTEQSPLDVVEVGALLRDARQRRSPTGTTVRYSEPADLSWTFIAERKAIEPIRAFLADANEADTIVIGVKHFEEPSSVEITVDGHFPTIPVAPRDMQRKRLADGRASFSLRVPVTIIRPDEGEEGRPERPRVIRQLAIVGLYSASLQAGIAAHLVDAVGSLIELRAAHRPITAAHWLAAAMFFSLAWHRRQMFRRSDGTDHRSAGRWVLITGAILVVLAWGLPDGAYFGANGIPQPFARQFVIAAALWAIFLPRRLALAAPIAASCLAFGAIWVADVGLLDIGHVDISAVGWWPYWTLAIAVIALAARRVLSEMEFMSFRAADERAIEAVAEWEARAPDGMCTPVAVDVKEMETAFGALSPDISVEVVAGATVGPLPRVEFETVRFLLHSLLMRPEIRARAVVAISAGYLHVELLTDDVAFKSPAAHRQVCELVNANGGHISLIPRIRVTVPRSNLLSRAVGTGLDRAARRA